MKARILFPIILTILLFSCTDKKADLEAKIVEVTKSMEKANFPEEKDMTEIVDLYENYISQYPDDAKTYDYMELKAKYEMVLGKYEASIASYDAIIDKYEKSDRTGEATYMQGYIYQNYLNDIDAAQKSYEGFLQDFPDHPLANDVTIILENIHLSDEELYQKIIQQAQEDSIPSELID